MQKLDTKFTNSIKNETSDQRQFARSPNAEIYGGQNNGGRSSIRNTNKKHIMTCQNSQQAMTGMNNVGGKKIMSTQKTKDKTAGGSPTKKKGILSGVPSSVENSMVQETDKSVIFQEPDSYYADPDRQSEFNFINNDANEIYDKSFQMSSDGYIRDQISSKEGEFKTEVFPQHNFKPIEESQSGHRRLNDLSTRGEMRNQNHGIHSTSPIEVSPAHFKEGFAQKSMPRGIHLSSNKTSTINAQTDVEESLLSAIGQVFENKQHDKSIKDVTRKSQLSNLKSKMKQSAVKAPNNKIEDTKGLTLYQEVLNNQNKPTKNKNSLVSTQPNFGQPILNEMYANQRSNIQYSRRNREGPIRNTNSNKDFEDVIEAQIQSQKIKKQSKKTQQQALLLGQKKHSVPLPFEPSDAKIVYEKDKNLIRVAPNEEVFERIIEENPGITITQTDKSKDNLQHEMQNQTFQDQFFKHLNRKGVGRGISNPNAKKKDVESAYFAKIPNQILNQTQNLKQLQSPNEIQLNTIIGHDYDSPSFTPNQERNSDIQDQIAKPNGQITGAPKNLLSSQFVQGSQSLNQMESIANIHSNEHNNPELLGKIMETNLSKYALESKIKDLKKGRNLLKSRQMQSRSFSQVDLSQSAGYGTIGIVDQAIQLDQNPRDSSRLPMRQELIDYKSLIPLSPRDADFIGDRINQNRNFNQNRLQSQPIYGDTRMSQSSYNLHSQIRRIRDGHQSVSSEQRRQSALSSRNSVTSSRLSKAKNSTIANSFADVLQEYQIEGRTIDKLERRLLVFELQRQKAQQIVEQAKYESEIQALTAAKNKLDKEDRQNHAKLVKESIESQSRLKASVQKQISNKQKEKVMKQTFDNTVDLRNDFKQGQQQRKEALKVIRQKQLLKNKQSMQKVKAEKITKQLKNQIIKQEKQQQIKEQKDINMLRKLMKEDLQATLEEEIRVHQKQLKELKELRDVNIRELDHPALSTWNSQSTNQLVSKFKGSPKNIPQTTRANQPAPQFLQKIDITKKEYIAPVKEINLYQRKQFQNKYIQQAQKQQRQMSQASLRPLPLDLAIPVLELDHESQSPRDEQDSNTHIKICDTIKSDIATPQQTPQHSLSPQKDKKSDPSSSRNQMQSNLKGSYLMTRSLSNQQIVPVRQQKKEEEEKGKTIVPKNNFKPFVRHLRTKSEEDGVLSRQQVRQQKEIYITEDTQKPNTQTLQKSATTNNLRQQPDQSSKQLFKNSKRLDKLRSKYDNQVKSRREIKLPLDTANKQSNFNSDVDLKIQKVKVPPLQLNSSQNQRHSEIIQDKPQSNQLQETANQIELQSQDQQAPTRVSKKLRIQIRKQSSTGSQGNRKLYLKDAPGDPKYPPQVMQRCLSSQGVVGVSDKAADFHQYIVLGSERITPKYQPEKFEQLQQDRLMIQSRFDLKNQKIQFEKDVSQMTPTIESNGDMQNDKRSQFNVHSKGIQSVELQKYSQQEYLKQTLPQGTDQISASPSPGLRNASQEEFEPMESTIGENTSPDPNYLLQYPDHDYNSDGRAISVSSSVRQFRSSRAIQALLQRQHRVAVTTQQIQEKITQKQQIEQKQQKEEAEAIELQNKQPTLMEQQMQLRNIQKRMTSEDQSGIKQKALNIIKSTQQMELDLIKNSSPLIVTDRQSSQEPISNATTSKFSSTNRKSFRNNKRKYAGSVMSKK